MLGKRGGDRSLCPEAIKEMLPTHHHGMCGYRALLAVDIVSLLPLIGPVVGFKMAAVLSRSVILKRHVVEEQWVYFPPVHSRSRVF